MLFELSLKLRHYYIYLVIPFVLYTIQAFIVEQTLSAYKKVRRLEYKTPWSWVPSIQNNKRQTHILI